MVAALLKHTHNLKNNGGTGVEAAPDKPAPMPICSCTELGHAELKELLADIIVGETDPTMFLLKLGWRSEQGCVVCRPVIHYYLQLSNRLINDRESMLAEYWTVVRNGNQVELSSDDEIEGHLEIQVRWDDQTKLSSYAKDASGLAAKLRTIWNDTAMPSSVNLGVAPGPGSWVSALVQDIGLLASPAGWEIYAGGHAEHPVKEGGLLGVAETEQQAVMLATACLQWYRQTAWYDEPLWAWTERMGFMSIRETLLDDQLQKELVAIHYQERDAALTSSMKQSLESSAVQGTV